MTLTISKFRRLLPLLSVLAVTVFTAACAPLTVPPQSEYPVGRARLVLPAGAWQDLGTSEKAVAGSVGSISLQTRTVGLRSVEGDWVAVLRVQANHPGNLVGPPQDIGDCPPQKDVIVEDAAAGSPVRADCLRLRRWGSGAQWLDKNRPHLVEWLGVHQITLNQPYTYISFRYVTQAGVWGEVDALVDHRLLRPVTHNAQEFLAAGRPTLQWGRDLAQAVRLSTGMVDGHLAIPPFPFPTPTSRP